MMLSHTNAAKILKCSMRTLVGHLSTGYLPSVKLGRERVIPRDAFFQRLNELALEESAKLRKPLAPGPTLTGRRRALPMPE